MSKFRRAARIDENQPEIVEELRKCGYSVQVGHDDILVGKHGLTFWFEIKMKDCLKKDGTFKSGTLQDTQEDLLRDWEGHYQVVTSAEEIIFYIESYYSGLMS